MSTAAEIAASIEPDKFTASIARRKDKDLPFDPTALPNDLPLILDASFYIDEAKQKLPQRIKAFVAGRTITHSSVVCSELSITYGILDPEHKETSRNLQAIHAILSSIDETNIVTPSANAWIKAGVISGALARTQYGVKTKSTPTPDEKNYQQGSRRRLLNDALIFLSAFETGAILVSANIKDIDLMLRIIPIANVLFYRPTQTAS
jgi:predicted nucleic acid-binding protein